jgi:hypothetical protein
MAVLWLIFSGGFLAALFWSWKRLFHRPEPALPAEDPNSPQALMERCQGRIHRLEAKRQVLAEMIDEAEDLKYRLAGSEVHRCRIPLMDRSLRLLRQEAHLIDLLLGRYYRQHHELELAVEADHFQQRLEKVTDDLGGDLLQFREEIDRLDEEYQQLILETEAQVEVENLLRQG